MKRIKKKAERERVGHIHRATSRHRHIIGKERGQHRLNSQG